MNTLDRTNGREYTANMTTTEPKPMDEIAGADVSLDAVAARYSRNMTEVEMRRFISRQREDRAAWVVRQREKKDKEE